MTTRRHVRDHMAGITGKTQLAGISPTVRGIAKRRVDSFVQRAQDIAIALDSLLEARQQSDSDPASAAIARLLNNPEFVAALKGSLEKLTAEIEASAPDAATPVETAVGEPTDAEGKGGNWTAEGSAPNLQNDPMRGSNLPGADSAGAYTLAHLHRDLAIQKSATLRFAATVGMDAAAARVRADPLLPPWDSPRWTSEARQYMRDISLMNGEARAHIAKGGEVIQRYFSE